MGRHGNEFYYCSWCVHDGMYSYANGVGPCPGSRGEEEERVLADLRENYIMIAGGGIDENKGPDWSWHRVYIVNPGEGFHPDHLKYTNIAIPKSNAHSYMKQLENHLNPKSYEEKLRKRLEEKCREVEELRKQLAQQSK